MSDSSQISPQNITALVLSGGQGRRLQGQDKGLVMLNDRPLVGHVIDRIRPQVGQVLVSANRNHDVYSGFGFDIVPDSFGSGQYCGPLAGILAGLNACTTEYLLSVPCDTPCLPMDLVERMYHELAGSSAEIVTVHDGVQLHPVIMLMYSDLGTALEAWLEQGGRSVQEWIASRRHIIMHDETPRAYTNLNTNDDFEAFAQSLCESH